MPLVENETPFGLASFFQFDRHGANKLVAMVSCSYALPEGVLANDARLALTEQQPTLPLEDHYWGDTGRSSLKIEGQAIESRPGTDIYLIGHVNTPQNKPASTLATRVQVGLCKKSIVVVGDRVWRRQGSALVPSRPKPFVAMPLCYERCFGGVAYDDDGAIVGYEEANPVGCGMYASLRQALNAPLPNFENRHELLSDFRDRPRPAGYGPICRAWEPRKSMAGTYDQQWIEQRSPYWPLDLDPRFFCAASPGLCSELPLRGGEDIHLEGFSPNGPQHFSLPRLELLFECILGGKIDRQPLVLDTVVLDTDEKIVTLGLRASLCVQGREHMFGGARVRSCDDDC